MKQRLTVWAITLVAAMLSAQARAEDFSGKVVRVLDGDTVEVLHDGTPERIRLDGIDCPEKGQAFGTKAKQFTSSLAFGKEITVKATGKDRYGRTLGSVVLPDGKDLNHELVKAGYAWWYREYSKDKTLEKLEAEAREAKRGLWADNNPMPPWAFRKQQSKLGKRVSLQKPYPPPYKGARTDKISLQYAVQALVQQAGFTYDRKNSNEHVGSITRKWVAPDIRNVPLRSALQKLLRPMKLTYRIENDAVVLEPERPVVPVQPTQSDEGIGQKKGVYTPEEVYKKCSNHAFGDPKLGYTVDSVAELLVGLWRNEHPGKNIGIHSKSATKMAGDWWKVHFVITTEGEPDQVFDLHYDPYKDRVKLISEPAQALYGPLHKAMENSPNE